MPEIGILYALASSLFGSFSAVASKEALRKEHSIEFTFFSSILVFIFFLPFLPFATLQISLLNLTLLFVSCILGAFSIYLSFKSLRHLDISIAIPLGDMSLVITVVLGTIFLKEILSLSQLLGVALVVVGAYLLQIHREKIDFLAPFRNAWRSRILHLLFLAALLDSVSSILGRSILKETDVMTYIIIAYFFLLINHFIFYLFLKKETMAESVREIRENFGWTLIAAAMRVSKIFLYSNALSLVYVGIAESINRMSTLFTVLIGGKLLKEDHFIWKTFASAVMIVGAILAIF